MFNLESIVRKNILNLKPYSSAREEFRGEAMAYLDANENPYNKGLNRYPDPLQNDLKEKIAEMKEVSVPEIFLGNGSDEPIDLLIRVFCEPRIDNIVAIDPTYGMYKVAADINGVEYRKVLLSDDFKLIAQRIIDECDAKTKLIFLCSPNNPTGNLLDTGEVIKILKAFKGIVILDEAYIDFAQVPGFLPKLKSYPNLVILQTFSKAWGLASIRLGMAFASEEIINLLNKIKYPYNINQLTQQHALEAIKSASNKMDWLEKILKERDRLMNSLKELSLVNQVSDTDANFFLVHVNDPKKIYRLLVERGIIVRDRSSVSLCEGCLRITVGTPDENDLLINALKSI